MLECDARRPPALHGEVALASPEDRAATERRVAASGWLCVPVSSPPRASRGELAEHIDAAIDACLASRGAPPPCASSGESPDAALSDRLFRARLVGAKGLVLSLDALSCITARGCLDPSDGATLAFLAAATRERPLSLVLPPDARDLRAFGPSVPLWSLLERAPDASPVAAVTASVEPPRRDEPSLLGLVATLEDTTGPRPLGEIERVFVNAYAPLVERATRGALPERAAAAVARWSAGFSKSYTEAHPTFRLTHKRPSMVLDLPRIAAKLGRLHGARASELVLVDAMRFDVGERVMAAVGEAVDGRAAIAERMLLWAALPTTTTTQLRTLAGGLDALVRAPDDEPDASLVARGARAGALRRVRVSGRDVFKLDAVEARVAEPALDSAALDDVVARTADALGRHLCQRADRTLVVVFGDHGFRLDAGPHGLTASHGGASPEEVLVPAYAWLVGGLH